MKTASVFYAVLCTVAILSACGGGGGGGSAGAPVFLPMPAAPAAEAPSAPAAPPCSVTLYGDSIIAGQYWDYTQQPKALVRHAEPPAATLKRLNPGFQVIDRSVSGITLAELARGYTPPGEAPRPAFNLDARSTTVVVIENGVIDSWLDADLVVFRDTLRGMVAQVRSEGRVPVLTGFSRQAVKTGPAEYITPDKIARRDQFDAAARALAVDLGVIFSDFGSADFQGAADIQDDVHPTKAYSDRLAERLARSISAAAPTCVGR